MRVRTIAFPAALASVAGLALGIWLGRVLAPPPSVSAPPPLVVSERRDGREAKLDSALTQSWRANLELAARIKGLEAMAGELSESDRSQLIERIISTLSDRDLQSILASTIRLSPDEIDDVRDLRGFSERLAKIAMEDTLQPGKNVAGAEDVVFTSSPQTGDVDSTAREQFGPDEPEIYAGFATEDFEGDTVMVKWYRRDQPEILLFQRYPIVPGEQHGYVWFRPDEDWAQGQYEVDIYSGDEAMTPLASGNYTVQ